MSVDLLGALDRVLATPEAQALSLDSDADRARLRELVAAELAGASAAPPTVTELVHGASWRFPLQLTKTESEAGLPRSIPWSVIAEHEAQAKVNHDHFLSRLAQRGGLSPLEAWCVAHDRHWRDRPTYEVIYAWLREVAG
jgi:hypothetical protein